MGVYGRGGKFSKRKGLHFVGKEILAQGRGCILFGRRVWLKEKGALVGKEVNYNFFNLCSKCNLLLENKSG